MYKIPSGRSGFSNVYIQPALEIGKEDDEYEREANTVADKVMRMSDGMEGKMQRMCTGCEEEEEKKMSDGTEGKLQMMVDTPVSIRKMTNGSGGGMKASKSVEQGIQNTKGNGQSLSPDLQSEMSSKVGADFSGVKIHTDENAVQMNKEVGAKAFTHGNDIYFNQGQYNPSSQSGKHLLAHELTHTVQQGKSIRRKEVGDGNDRYVLNIAKFPWAGKIDTKGWSDIGFHKEPKPSENKQDNIWPSLANGDEVQVLAKVKNNWFLVSRIRNGVKETGYIDWRYVHPFGSSDVAITEKVTDGTPKSWNNTYKWNSKFDLLFGKDQLKVTVKLYSDAMEDEKRNWASEIEDKWSDAFTFEAKMGEETYDFKIIVDVVWVTDKQNAHHIVKGGKSTTNMTNWGTSDLIDVTHEFGHMLGNKEEYFTVDGVKYGAGRQKGKGIMNNPAENPEARHFNLIKSEAAKVLGVKDSECKVK